MSTNPVDNRYNADGSLNRASAVKKSMSDEIIRTNKPSAVKKSTSAESVKVAETVLTQSPQLRSITLESGQQTSRAKSLRSMTDITESSTSGKMEHVSSTGSIESIERPADLFNESWGDYAESVDSEGVTESLPQFSYTTDPDLEKEIRNLWLGKMTKNNLATPSLTQEQERNISELETASKELIDFAKTMNGGIQRSEEILQITAAYEKMLKTAQAVIKLFDGSLNVKYKDIKIDFFDHLTKALQSSSLLTRKIEKLLAEINKALKELLIIDFENIEKDRRIKSLVDVKAMSPVKTPFDQKRKELKILQAYKEVLIKLVHNLEWLAKQFNAETLFQDMPPGQKELLDKVTEKLDKIVDAFLKLDAQEYELRKYIREKDNQAISVTYKIVIYEGVARVITTQLIDIMWVHANRTTLAALIELQSLELNLVNKNSDLFYKDCLAEFELSLNSQKYDAEFLQWWIRMMAAGLVCYLNVDGKVLLSPQKIPFPSDVTPANIENYQLEIKKFIDKSTVILSRFAFRDSQFLTQFFSHLSDLKKRHAKFTEPKSDLEMHAQNFSFLESLLVKTTANEKTLKEFNEELKKTNPEAMKKLERKAQNNGLKCLPVEMVISFMLRFYRAVNHKYIADPIAKLKLLYTNIYPEMGRIIQDAEITTENADDSLMQQNRRLYFILTDAAVEIQAFRVDQIGESKHHCYFYTHTSVKVSFPGQPEFKNPNSIRYSFRKIAPAKEEKEAENSLNKKLNVLGSLIDAAEFPHFMEREPEQSQ